MNISQAGACPRCGAAIPANSPEELCPACLLSGALAPTGAGAETVSMAVGRSLSLGVPTECPSEFGGYRLLGLLGRGGMGAVYEAEQRSTGRRVALKMLGQQLDSPEMRQRFLREGRLAAGVNHPNSLYVFGSEEIEGLPVITMEIAGGGTLQDRLKKHGPLPVAEAVDAILDVIAGLESAFARGVLHRDIKPSNCFVGPDGSVKVGDFGLSVSLLARNDTFVTAHGRIMGTPAYASPEQLRGDRLDVRADIYSVGATLFTLLTDRPPFEGENAVQVVAQAVNRKPMPLTELRSDIPPALEQVVARCLAKEPERRYADYGSLRDALLPFSSREPEPASMKLRTSAGWIDYLIAFLPPYVMLMLLVGGEKLLIAPVVERTLYSARYYIVVFAFGFLYFAISEGIWGAGLGKWLKGLRVVRPGGDPPGFGRALIRILIPIGCIEAARVPLSMAIISDASLTGPQVVWFIVVANVCAWIPVVLTWCARRANGFATIWDLASGTRVVVKAKGAMRPSIELAPQPEVPAEPAVHLGPFRILERLRCGRRIVATDPVLRRRVWLLRRDAFDPSPARRDLARPGRLRWLQTVETKGAAWEAFEAPDGLPLQTLVEGGKCIPWSTLRHWLHDLASELWDATGDGTLPAVSSLDHVWITRHGQAVLLDVPWPQDGPDAEHIAVGDLAGQQRFLNAVAGRVDGTHTPLHARGVLRNLAAGKFEKLSFLTGTLRGLLDKPAEVSRGIRAGSIFMLPCYYWVLVYVGYYHGGGDQQWGTSVGWRIMVPAMAILGVIGVTQLLEFPFHSTAAHAIFRLAIVDAGGERATIPRLLVRWAIVWLPLFLPMLFVALLARAGAQTVASVFGAVVALLWMGAAVYAVVHPHRGLPDRLAGTWVVRR